MNEAWKDCHRSGHLMYRAPQMVRCPHCSQDSLVKAEIEGYPSAAICTECGHPSICYSDTNESKTAEVMGRIAVSLEKISASLQILGERSLSEDKSAQIKKMLGL